MTDAEAIWAAKSDDALLEAAEELSEYTDEGQRIIRAELKRRGLPQPEPAIKGVQTGDAALVCILATGDPGLILLAKSLLESEGIEYLVRGENIQDLFGAGRLGGHNYVTGPAEFCVRAEDAERARTLLDGQDPQSAEPAADPNDDA